MARSALLNVMVQSALKAGRSLARGLRRGAESAGLAQGSRGLRSARPSRKAEDRSSRRSFCGRARPMVFMGEESEEETGTDGAHRWIVDPLDGTTNFSARHAAFRRLHRALNAMARSWRGLSTIHRPTSSTQPSAAAGRSSNDRRLRVAGRKAMSGCGHWDRRCRISVAVHQWQVPGRAAPRDGRMRRASGVWARQALDLAYVAAGRLDGVLGKSLWNPGTWPQGSLLIRRSRRVWSPHDRRDRHVRHENPWPPGK